MTFIAAYHRSPGGNTHPFRQVIHATCPGQPKDAVWFWSSGRGMAVSTAHYFQNPSSGGSAHFVADIGEIVGCVDETAVAWHAPPNPHTLGYEICGQSWYTREQWLSEHVWPAVVLTARQVLADAKRYGIPVRRLSVAQVERQMAGQCGHVDVSQAFHQSDHTDPGPGFPWDEFMALLEGRSATPVLVADGRKPTSGTSGTPANSNPAKTTDEDVMSPAQEKKLDDLAALVKALHEDHKVILHGGAGHPYSIDSIAEHVGVNPDPQV